MRKFLLFLIPQSLSLLGSSVLQFAMIWTIVFTYGSGTMLLLSTIMGFIPQIISSFLIGPTLDKRPKKLMIVLSDGISAIAALFFLMFSFFGYSDARIILPVLAVRSFCQGIQTPSYNALLPLLSPEGRIVRANGLKGLSSSIVMLLSPAIAAFLFAFEYALVYALLIDILTAALAISIIVFQRLPDVRGNGRVDLKSGIVYAKNDKYIYFLLMANAIALFAISPGAFMTPLFLSREYGATSLELSFSEMAYSIGMIGGGFFVSLLGENVIKRKGYAISLLVYGICLLLMGAMESFTLYIVFNLCIGISSPHYSAFLSAELQERTEPGMLGRVMALFSSSSSLSLPLGMVLFGPLSDIMPIRIVFALSGMITVATAVVMDKRKALS